MPSSSAAPMCDLRHARGKAELPKACAAEMYNGVNRYPFRFIRSVTGETTEAERAFEGGRSKEGTAGSLLVVHRRAERSEGTAGSLLVVHRRAERSEGSAGS